MYLVFCTTFHTFALLDRHRVHASWMYMAKLAAAKEFAYMKALKALKSIESMGAMERTAQLRAAAWAGSVLGSAFRVR